MDGSATAFFPSQFLVDILIFNSYTDLNFVSCLATSPSEKFGPHLEYPPRKIKKQERSLGGIFTSSPSTSQLFFNYTIIITFSRFVTFTFYSVNNHDYMPCL